MPRWCNTHCLDDWRIGAQRLVRFVLSLLVASGLVITAFGNVFATDSDSNSLPEGVTEMRDALLDAAKSGDVKAMGDAIELNELPPQIGAASAQTQDPIDAIQSLVPPDKAGALVKTIEAVLMLPPALTGDLYVWPYLAVREPGPFTKHEHADLSRILTQDAMAVAVASGRYPGLRIEIGADGTWHYIGMNAEQQPD